MNGKNGATDAALPVHAVSFHVKAYRMNAGLEFRPYPLTVRSSAIDRRGVFADSAIPARHKVIEYAGEKIRLREALRRVGKILRGRGPKRLYIARLNRHYAIDGGVGGNGSQFINHCCEPNLVIRRSNGRIWFYSKRPIRKGQELTIDYRFGPVPNPTVCQCGARTCRGTIHLQRKPSRRF
jgi:uncharacterized protein